MNRYFAAIVLACAACAAGNAAAQEAGATDMVALSAQTGAMQPVLQAQNPAGTPAAAMNQQATPGHADNRHPGALGNLFGGIGPLTSRLGVAGVPGAVVAMLLLVVLAAVGLMLATRTMRRQQHGMHSMREPVFADGQTVRAGHSERDGTRIEPQPIPQFEPPATQPEWRGTAPPKAAPPEAAPHNAGSTWGVPADFDVPGFLRNAKAYFIRLQASWDRSDLDDLREFTAPDMFAELALQLEERGSQHSQTTVAILNADLLGIETTGTDYIASVKFSGMLKEGGRPMAEPFIEIWSLARPVAGHGGWLLAGIQQLQ